MSKQISIIALRHYLLPNLWLFGRKIETQRWCLPGGHANPDETAEQAARRELLEETGLQVEKLNVAKEMDKGDKHLTLYVGTCPFEAHLDGFYDDPDQEFCDLKFLDPDDDHRWEHPDEDDIFHLWLTEHEPEGKVRKPNVEDWDMETSDIYQAGLGKAELRKSPWIHEHNVQAATNVGPYVNKDAKLVGKRRTPAGIVHHYDNGEGDHFFAIHPKNDMSKPPVSAIHVTPWVDTEQFPEHEGEYYVQHSATVPEHQGKGMGTALYHSALKNFGTLLSSAAMSPRSEATWRKLGKQPGVKVKYAKPNTDKPYVGRKVSTKSELEKGLRQAPYKPLDVPKAHKRIVGRWAQAGSDLPYEDEDRQAIPRLEGNARIRGLHRLHAATKVRKNPHTGEREFLLHRGMREEEHGKHFKGSSVLYPKKTSWSADQDTAQTFGAEAHWPTKEGYKPVNQLVSAWVPESKIHHIPKMLGQVGDYHNKPSGPFERSGEWEVITSPGQFQATTNELQPNDDKQEQYTPRPVKTTAKSALGKSELRKAKPMLGPLSTARPRDKTPQGVKTIPNAIGIEGKQKPGIMVGVRGKRKGKKIPFFGNMEQGLWVAPNSKHAQWIRRQQIRNANNRELLPNTRSQSFEIREKPGKIYRPMEFSGKVDARKQYHPKLGAKVERRSLHHGIDMGAGKRLSTGTLTDEAGMHVGKHKNHLGQDVFVKQNIDSDQMADMGVTTPSFSAAKREALYHNMAHDFFDLGHHVPATSHFKHQGQEFSAMRWADEHHVPLKTKPKKNETIKRLTRTGELHKIGFMNYLLGNTDRHGGNFLVGPHNLALIDHGLTFDYGNNERPFQSAYMPEDAKIPEHVKKWVMKLNPLKFQQMLARNGAPSRIRFQAVRRLKAVQDAIKRKKVHYIKDLSRVDG